LKAYQAKGDTLDETYVSMNQVWDRVTYSSGSGDAVFYQAANGTTVKVTLSQLNKEIVFNSTGSSPQLTFIYTNDDMMVTKTVTMHSSSYPLDVSWTLTPLKAPLVNASLYLSTFYDLRWHFNKANIPGLMDWVNPWDVDPNDRETNGDLWTVAGFSSATLRDGYLGLYDDSKDVGFAFRFNTLPQWGNVGALGNRQIDSVRFQYDFNTLGANQTVSCSYQMLTLSKSSYPTLQPESLQGLFDIKPAEYTIVTRDFKDDIEENNIGFLVYDRNQLDTQILHSKLLQLIYSNDRYVIFKIIEQP
jgi:hypothetical protein